MAECGLSREQHKDLACSMMVDAALEIDHVGISEVGGYYYRGFTDADREAVADLIESARIDIRWRDDD